MQKLSQYVPIIANLTSCGFLHLNFFNKNAIARKKLVKEAVKDGVLIAIRGKKTGNLNNERIFYFINPTLFSKIFKKDFELNDKQKQAILKIKKTRSAYKEVRLALYNSLPKLGSFFRAVLKMAKRLWKISHHKGHLSKMMGVLLNTRGRDKIFYNNKKIARIISCGTSTVRKIVTKLELTGFYSREIVGRKSKHGYSAVGVMFVNLLGRKCNDALVFVHNKYPESEIVMKDNKQLNEFYSRDRDEVACSFQVGV